MSVKVDFDEDGWPTVSDGEGYQSARLMFGPDEWQDFIGDVKSGIYDIPDTELLNRLAALESELADIRRQLGH